MNPSSSQRPSLRLAPYLMVAAAVLATGCSTLKSPGSWFGGGAADETAAAEPSKATPYYTSEVGVKLYAEPHFSESYIVALPLHQKVHRSKVERGFAYVEVEGSGKTGWLDNSKLIWRVPDTAKSPSAPSSGETPAGTPEEAGKVEAAPDQEVEPEPSPAPAKGSILSPAAAEAREAPPEKPQPAEPQVNPSIFSPF